MRLPHVLILLLFAQWTALGQDLNGVVDIHVHSGPDSIPRSIDAIDLARLAKTRGMRGLVLKNHYESTAALAYVVRKEVPGIEIFGGIDLNLSVGGMNPFAVERMAMMKGGFGRFVWMATFDSEAQVRYSKENRPFVAISKNGELLPEVKSVIATIAKHQLILATGHSTPAEGLLLIREAAKQGVTRIVVTHAMIAPIHMSTGQMQEAARLGAYIEFVYNGLIGSSKEFTFADYAEQIRKIGPAHVVLSSDLGQVGNPLHPDGWVDYLAGLKTQGFSDSELRQMCCENPAKLLNLPRSPGN